MKRYKTLEEFLEFSCAMAPPMLVEHFEPHREWVEGCLENYLSIEDEDRYELVIEDLWLTLPEIPREFFYRSE